MGGADLRLRSAVGAGRLAGVASRRLRLGGGTTLPGDVSRWVDPAVLTKLTSSLTQGVVLVTGTNGKTTTAALLRTMLQACGLRVAGNSSGSNLIYGLTAAALERSDRHGHIDLDWLVLEVDELSAPRAVAEIRPRGLVVLNIFRDQLDRSFEVDQVADRLQAAVWAMPTDSFWVGNADDPRVASFGWEGAPGQSKRILFGLAGSSLGGRELPAVADARSCPRCRTDMEFERVYYAHCGVYHCPQCGYRRPEPHVVGRNIRAQGPDRLDLDVSGAEGWAESVSIPLGGLFNAANVAAAMTAAVAMRADRRLAAESLARFRPAFGRAQLAAWRGAQIRLLLAKNPAGMAENLDAVLTLDRSPVLALALNDLTADGRDVSWIWDVELERLGEARDIAVVVSGTRAHELVLRLSYAGVAADRLVVRPEPEEALTALADRATPGVAAPALLTYTAMLAWHRLLVRSGAGNPFFAPT